jgi:MFS family permease
VTSQTGRVEVDSKTGRVIIATTVLGSAVAMLTATVVSVALPPIAQDFQVSSAGQQWVVNAYLLTVASLILIGGSFGDRFGRVRIYRIGVTWFAAASLGAALSPGIEWLIVFRLLQGIGGGSSRREVCRSSSRHCANGTEAGEWASGLA